MQTSAHPTLLQLQWRGTLIHAAQARTRILDGEVHSVPVLCMDIELDNTLHNVMHVEQPFPPDHFPQAEAAARRLKKGMVVSVDVPPWTCALPPETSPTSTLSPTQLPIYFRSHPHDLSTRPPIPSHRRHKAN